MFVTVDREDCQLARFRIAGRGHVNRRDIPVDARGQGRASRLDAEHLTAGVAGGEGERVEDRLPPGAGVRFGPDGCDHVDQLSQAGGGHPVAVP